MLKFPQNLFMPSCDARPYQAACFVDWNPVFRGRALKSLHCHRLKTKRGKAIAEPAQYLGTVPARTGIDHLNCRPVAFVEPFTRHKICEYFDNARCDPTPSLNSRGGRQIRFRSTGRGLGTEGVITCRSRGSTF